LEAYSKKRTTDAITALGSLYPAEALLLVPKTPSPTHSTEDLEKGDPSLDFLSGSKFTVEKIEVGLLDIGDIVRVQHGSSPPADGTIVTGINSAFDESSLTGESRLVQKQLGDKVYAGTINGSTMVDVRVDAIGGGTM
jgi:P-type Cu+ transporter